MVHAVATQRADAAWRSRGRGHLVTDRSGATLSAIDADAERMLMASHLLRQHVSMTQAPRAAPCFVRILVQELAEDVLRVDRVSALPLTPLQRRIALFTMGGGERAECGARFGVSAEALKKHLRAIYDASGAANWLELAGLR